jgi:uncharacterized protein YodC (DUF2158 family)
MAESNFKMGDVVELISGGPPMTINTIRSGGIATIQTSWFSGKKLESGLFSSSALKKYLPPEDSK